MTKHRVGQIDPKTGNANKYARVNAAGTEVVFRAAGDDASDAEFIRDTIGAALVAGANITITVNDAGDTITIALDTAAEAERIRDVIGAAIVAGANVTVTVNDAGDTITIASTGGGGGSLTVQDENSNVATSVTQLDFQGAGVVATTGTGEVIVTIPGYTDEQARDALGAALVAGSNVTITVNDAGDTITISSTGGGGGGGGAVAGTSTTDSFTATAGQTAFVLTATPTAGLMVFRNGVMQRLTTDYTVSGSTVTLTSGAGVGDTVTAIYGTGIVGGTSGLGALLGEVFYKAGSDTFYNPTGSTHSQVDSANIKVTVDVPASGTVYVEAYALASQQGSGQILYWAVWDQTAGAVISGTDQEMVQDSGGVPSRRSNRWKITGLTPGTRVLSLASRSTSFTQAAIYTGPTYGPVVFQVFGGSTSGGSGGGDSVTASKTANYTASSGEFVPCNAVAGGFTVTLPAASAGRYVTVVKTDASANVVSVVGASGATINGDSSGLQVSQWVAVTYVADGTNWIVKSAYAEGGSGVIPGSVLASVSYLPSTVVNGAAIATSLTDVDATNLVVTFTAPASGKVEVMMSMFCQLPSSAQLWWTLRAASTEVTGARAYMSFGNSSGLPALRLVYETIISGLTPGNSYTWKWAMAAAASGGAMSYGDDGTNRLGPAVMKVTAL